MIAHNEERGIERALDAILTQKGDGVSREVIVVDDGSTDRTAEVVTAVGLQHPEVRLVRLATNRGRGFARATGIGEASGRYVATVDADIVIPREWQARCLESINGVDAVAGIAVPDGDVSYVGSRFGLEPKAVGHATDITGSNALYRRELFDEVSFDPHLREGEDVALSHALRERAARVRTVPGLVVRHEEHKSLSRALAWMFQSGWGAARQLYRYREIRRPDLAFGGWLIACFMGASLRRRPAVAVVVPVTYLGAASTAHIWEAFAWRPAGTARFAAAVTLNMAMLAAYFSGRTAGAVLIGCRRAKPSG
jgi:glycosyltransferase involved in cell wall biosynthesis